MPVKRLKRKTMEQKRSGASRPRRLGLRARTGSAESGWNIRRQLHFQQHNMVFQLQLAFLQTAQLQFLMTGSLRKQVDHRIQVTMLDFQFDNAALYIFAVRHGHDVASIAKLADGCKQPPPRKEL